MPTLTDRQREIMQRLDRGMGAREIAQDLGITRNAVYQQIQRLRNYGVLEPGWTPTGVPIRERERTTDHVLARLLNGADDDEHTRVAGSLALVAEMRRVRDELDAIARRITQIIPR